MNSYKNFPTDILIDTDWLKQHLADPQLKIVDVRAPYAYRQAHVPGAISLDLGRVLINFAYGIASLAEPDSIAQALGKHGISNNDTIVIYDDAIDQPTAYTYFALRYIGHRNIKVLDGGWLGWANANVPTTNDIPKFPATQYTAHVADNLRTDANWIQANASRGDVVLLDARTPGEFAMGHIPGAVNLEYTANLSMRTGMYKDANEIGNALASIGATQDKEIVTYCHSGFRSSHMFMTLQLLGYERVRNYDGSTTDWAEVQGLPLE
jgi:thiosulfate/3-mercaptopyruvate sulfurtransferase